MKLAKIALSVAAVFASSVAMAGNLTTSKSLELLAFDGQKVKKDQSLQVNDGKAHQAVVQIVTLVRDGNDETMFESSPFVLTFNGSQEDVVITTKELRNRNDVVAFEKAPQFQVKTKSGNAISVKQDVLKGEGLLPNSNVVENLSNYNSGTGVAALPALATTQMQTVMPVSGKSTKGKVVVQGENVAEQQLQYWFQQADKATQKRFLDWAKKQ